MSGDELLSFQDGMRRLGVDVSRETLDRLSVMVSVLERWQRAINLISHRTLQDIWVRHILDSAQLVPLLEKDATSLVDLGSGAGFPGLVLALLRPDMDMTLIESDARKAAYLGEAVRNMGMQPPPKIVIGRAEAIPSAQADLVTARALAPLGQLLRWADRHRSDTAICLFHKGRGWQSELTDAMKDWDIPYRAFPSVTDRDGVILRIGSYRPAGLRDRQPEGRSRENHDRN
jgi:16S rRNA (guanine527-N7)-methyltransferase